MTKSRTKSTLSRHAFREGLTEEIVQELRIERILKVQDEGKWIVYLKGFLNGDLEKLRLNEEKNCKKIASNYEIDENDMLLFFSS